MNFIDFIILAIVLGVLGLIVYFNFIKKTKIYVQNVRIEEIIVIVGKRNEYIYKY